MKYFILSKVILTFRNAGNVKSNIGIKHCCSCINVCQVPREVLKIEAPRKVLKTEAEGRGFQHLPRNLANVNVLENNV